jgi:hypothetical protein
MDISFSCGKCGQQLVTDEGAAGQLIDCPKCGLPLEVPYKSTPLNKPATLAAAAPPKLPTKEHLNHFLALSCRAKTDLQAMGEALKWVFELKDKVSGTKPPNSP